MRDHRAMSPYTVYLVLQFSAALLLPVVPLYGAAKRRIEAGVTFQEVG